MPHMPPTLAFVLVAVVAVAGCDTAPEAKVPSQAARGLRPATIELSAATDATVDLHVAAWVNGKPLTRALLDARVARAAQHGSTLPPVVRRRQILERLVDDELVRQWVERSAVEVGPEEVDARIDGSIRDVFGSPESLRQHLQARGETLDEHRSATRLELAEEKLLAAGGEPLTDAALERMYREVANRPATTTMVQVVSLHFGPAVSHARAAKIASGIRDEADLATLGGKRRDLGWVDHRSLGGPLADRLLAVEPPAASGVIETPTGPEVYWIRARAKRPTAHFVEVRGALEARARSIARAAARDRLVRNLRAVATIEIVDSELSERRDRDARTPTASPDVDSGSDPIPRAADRAP